MSREFIAWAPDFGETVEDGATIMGEFRMKWAAEAAAKDYEYEDLDTMNIAVQEVEAAKGQARIGEPQVFAVLREFDPTFHATAIDTPTGDKA